MNFVQLGLIVITAFMAHTTTVTQISFSIRRTIGVAIHAKPSNNTSAVLFYVENVYVFGPIPTSKWL